VPLQAIYTLNCSNSVELRVELRGLEPLTPTLPGAGKSRDKAQLVPFGAVVGVVKGPTVVRVVVRTVGKKFTSASSYSAILR
jgi:hypothetical protein